MSVKLAVSIGRFQRELQGAHESREALKHSGCFVLFVFKKSSDESDFPSISSVLLLSRAEDTGWVLEVPLVTRIAP